MKNSIVLADLMKGKKYTCNVVCNYLFHTGEMESLLGKENTRNALDVLNGVKVGPYKKECSSASISAVAGCLCVESYGDNGLMCVDIILSNRVVSEDSECPLETYSIITIGEPSFSVIGEQTNLFASDIEFVADVSEALNKANAAGRKYKLSNFDFFVEEGVRFFVRETVRKNSSCISPFKEKIVRKYSCNLNYETAKGCKRYMYHEIHDFEMRLVGVFSALRFGTKVLEPMQDLYDKDTGFMLECR